MKVDEGFPGEGGAHSVADVEADLDSAAAGDGPALVRLRDLPIRVSAELDRKRAPLSEVLAYHPGSIIRLERSAGENVDLLMDGLPVGSGEVVVIENTVGLRVTALSARPEGERR